MFEDHDASVFDALSHSHLLSSEKLEEFNRLSREKGQSLASAVLDSGIIERKQLLESVALYLQCEFLADPPASIPDEVSGRLTPQIAHRYAVVPIRVRDYSIDLVARDPFNFRIVEDLIFFLIWMSKSWFAIPTWWIN